MNKLGINETLDLIKLFDVAVKEFETAMKSFGDIVAEDLVEAVRDHPEVIIKATWGAWDIPAELQDLDSDEKDRLLNEIMPIMKRMVGMFIPT